MATLTTFTAGTTIRSADVNANFAALNAEVEGTVVTLSSSVSTVTNIGTGEDTLMTYTIPAGTLSGIGDGFEVLAAGTTFNNVNAKTLRFYLTGVAGSGTGYILNPVHTAPVGQSWYVRIVAMYTAANSWYINSMFQLSTDNTSDFMVTQLVTVTVPSAAIPLMFTGQATATGDLAMGWMMVRAFRAP